MAVEVLLDAGPLIALADADSDEHEQVLEYLSISQSHGEVLLLPVTVLPEVDWWVTKYLGVDVELAILRDVADRRVRLEGLTPADLERYIDLISEYADSKLGLVDASIATLAERLGITRIFTLDRRHFSMPRPRHRDHFEIVPSCGPGLENL